MESIQKIPESFEPRGDKYAVSYDFVIEVGPTQNVTHRIQLPAGYTFDGASIPRIFWPIVGSPFEPRLMLAACVHDWYCEHSADDYQSRVIGDSVFFFLLRRANVPRWRRVLMYLAVRLNSWFFYGRRSCG